jgi:hypothetical protein
MRAEIASSMLVLSCRLACDAQPSPIPAKPILAAVPRTDPGPGQTGLPRIAASELIELTTDARFLTSALQGRGFCEIGPLFDDLNRFTASVDFSVNR